MKTEEKDTYYDELIKKRIGEALRKQSQEERLDFATLEAWVEADRERRKLKNRTKRLLHRIKDILENKYDKN